MADGTDGIAMRPGNDIQDGRLTLRSGLIGTGTIVNRIESILESTFDCLANAQEMSIPLASRRNSHRRGDVIRVEQVHFPGKTLHEARKFGTLYHVGLSGLS